MIRVFALLSVILFNVHWTEQAYFLEYDFIERIHEKATTWKAGINFDPKLTKEVFVRLLGSRGVQSAEVAKNFKTNDVAYKNIPKMIPQHFDARKKWLHCNTIGEVRDQGNCGSSWAIATSSAFADRLCIASNAEFNRSLSAEEITFCCHLCGFGCFGGFPIQAWKYFQRHGLVTGGYYGTNEGCAPYRVPPCFDNAGNNVCHGKRKEWFHRCSRKCNGNYNVSFFDDHKHTRDAYHLTYATIQRDILLYGPVEASFYVYDDFPSYKEGVYTKSENASYLGTHAAKLIGWGEEYGVPYWLLVNSWSKHWGDDGTFKIRRGTNECGIDNSTTAGVPVIY